MKRDEGPWIEEGHDDPNGSGDSIGSRDSAGSGDSSGSGDPACPGEPVARRVPVDKRPSPAGARPERTPSFERAWAELLRVHELTEARILREACRLRQSFDRGAFPPPTGPASVRGPVRRPPDAELRIALWRTRVRGELELALVDGIEPHALSRFCVVHGVHRWPSARELAGASLALEDCSSGRDLLQG